MLKRKSWEDIHKMGLVKFIMVYGICMFGFFFIVTNTLMSYFRGRFRVEDLLNPAFWASHCVAVIVAGTVYGYLMWIHHLGQMPIKSEDIDKLENIK